MHYLISNEVKRLFLDHLVGIIRDSGKRVALALGNNYTVDLYIPYRRGQVVVRIQTRYTQNYCWIVFSDGEERSKLKRRMKARFIFQGKAILVDNSFYSVDFKRIDAQKFLSKLDQVRELLERQYDRERMGVSEMTGSQLTILRK